MAKKSKFRSNNAYAPQSDIVRDVVLLDSGEPAVPPDASTHDLFLGRLVTGSSEHVLLMKEDLQPAHVTEVYGQWVIPYFPVRLLANVEKPSKVVNRAADKLYAVKQRQIDITLGTAVLEIQKYGSEFGVTIPIYDRAPVLKEAERICQSASHATHLPVDVPYRMSRFLIYASPNEREVEYAAELVNHFSISHATLTMPLICGVPKAVTAQA
jgi:hypothetical protein